MIPFPDKKYKIIYADPPWEYEGGVNSKRGSASLHYDTLSDEGICNLQVQSLADDDCFLFIWGTWAKLPSCIEVIEKWGFKYTTSGFVWIKQYSNGTNVLGLGHYTRGNTEYCLLATRGKPKRVNSNISQLIITQQTEHSKKPNLVRDRIVQLCGDLPRIELFSRIKIHGWDVWGNDDKLNLEPLEAFSQ